MTLFFRTIISVNQLSFHGAVAEMREECESCHDKTGGPVVMGQSNPSFVPSVMKTHIPLTEDPAQEEDILQRYRERIAKFSQQDKVSKFCSDAGFLTAVEVGQYFMTRGSEEFSQFTDSVACREYTLPKDKSTHPTNYVRNGGIRFCHSIETKNQEDQPQFDQTCLVAKRTNTLFRHRELPRKKRDDRL